MANKGHSNRQKRISYQGRVQIRRKEHVWTFKQSPGPHGITTGATLAHILRDVLKVADNTREIKYVVQNKNILVNGKRVKDHRFPLGLMDVLELKESGKKYRVYLTHKNKFILNEMNKEAPEIRPCRVVKKTILGKDKVQANFQNGFSWILPKGFDLKVGDSVIYDITKQTFTEKIKLGEGTLVYVVGGPHVGKFGVIKGIVKGDLTKANEVTIESNGEITKTMEKYVFAVPESLKL